jgi:SPP1 family predicted phage head-tail adaptor
MSRYTLDSSSLNRRITIQSRASTLDSFGQQVTTWTDLLSCWASLESQSGKELLAAQAINSELTDMVTVLYRSTVTAAMRVLYQGRVLNIQSVIDPDTAHVALQLMCSEGLNQG